MYIENRIIFSHILLIEGITICWIFFMESNRISPSWTQVWYSLGMRWVQFSQLFHECFNRRESKLQGNSGNGLTMISLAPFKLFHLIILFDIIIKIYQNICIVSQFAYQFVLLLDRFQKFLQCGHCFLTYIGYYILQLWYFLVSHLHIFEMVGFVNSEI